MDSTYCPYRPQSRSGEHMQYLTLASSGQDVNEKQKHSEETKPSSSQKAKTSSGKSRVAEEGKKIKKDLDKIMDEIDDVLEENAEEFIKSYVQRGGE